jgi:DNA-binding NarL/FixJ family response regulator
MTPSNSVIIQINSRSIVQLINALDLLKQSNIAYNIIEELAPPTQDKESAFRDKNSKKLLGKKGLDILQLLSDGYSYNEIAEKINITVNGVRYYVKKVFKSLEVNNGRDAVRIYLTELKNKQ